MNKNNLKWLFIIFLSSIVIIISGFQYFHFYKSLSHKRKVKKVDYEKYYDKKVSDITLLIGDNNTYLSNNRNKLLIGLDTHDDEVFNYLSRVKSGIDFSKYDIDIYFLTKNNPKQSQGIAIEKYESQNFDNFFNIVKDDYFIFLIDTTNKIKYYYKYRMPKPEDVQSLIKRYAKDNGEN